MARGYPDYFGQSAWPKYGKMYIAEYNSSIPSGNIDAVVDLSMQGQVVWGKLDLISLAAIDVQIEVSIDDLTSMQLTWDDFLESGIDGHPGFPIRSTYFSTDWLTQSFSLAFPVPFRYVFKVEVRNQALVDVSVVSRFGYYQVV